MGGAVSSGRDNNELVDNLMSGNYIRTRTVEQVFRGLDRADYMSPEARDQAYKDLAWRNGPLHLSAPCIYSEVMEALELKPGLSFLNVGSGTGYLSTLVGLIIGSSGVSHGVEALPFVIDYANKKLNQFIENSITLDEFDFCMPKYYTGNGLCLARTHTYDRVYCGAGVLAKYEHYFKLFTKVGGVLVMPLADTLVQLKRVSCTHWTKRNLLHVSFALLRDPAKDELEDLVKLDEASPASLQVLARAAIRSAMRAGLMRRHPELRAPPPPPPPAPRAGPRRICIPYEAGDDDDDDAEPWSAAVEGFGDLNSLHDLDEAGGAHEMNALLSLVLSMSQNRQAGSLQLLADEDLGDDDPGDEDPGDEGPGDEDPGDEPGAARRSASRSPQPGTSADAKPSSTSESKAEAPKSKAEAPKSNSEAPKSKVAAPKSKTKKKIKTIGRLSGAVPLAPRVLPRTAEPWDSSSGDDETTQVMERKRQKLDSGLGEGTASSASPDKSDGKTPPSQASHSGEDSNDQDTDMPWCDEDESVTSSSSSDSASDSESGGDAGAERAAPGGKAPGAELKRKKLASRHSGGLNKTVPEVHRRLQKRRRARSVPGRAHRASGSDSGAEEGCPLQHAHCTRPAPRDFRGPGLRDLRRVRLSLAMKRGVKELPLPHALKQYVNYGRCYQI